MDLTSLSSLQALQSSTQAGANGAPAPDPASISRFQQLLGEPQSPTLAADGPGMLRSLSAATAKTCRRCGAPRKMRWRTC